MTRAASARLFAALDLPVWVRDELAAWTRSARLSGSHVRVLEPELLHVTLCFLGWRPAEEVDAIAAAVVACAAPVAELELGAPLWLPPRRPRVLAIELHDPSRQLAALQSEVTDALLTTIEWEPERRRYRPHITVARMREGAAPRDRTLPPTPALAFAGAALTLYRSFLARSGASYEAQASVPLS